MKRYLLDSSGNIAIITSLTLGLMILGAGVAVDYSGSTSEYARMQTALDSAVLAAATQENAPEGQLKQIIRNTVRQNFTPTKANDIDSLDVEVDIVDEKIFASVGLDYSTSFMSMFGRPTMPLHVQSGGPLRRIPALNIALVVDTTDSMSGANMADLQAAADELIDALEDTGADVHMALVPYAQYVNVGLGNRDADWVDASKIELHPGEPSTAIVPIYEGGTAPVCIRESAPRPVYESDDGILVDTGLTTTDCEEWSPGTEGQVVGTEEENRPAYTQEFKFNGCMGSRNAPDNRRPEAGPLDRIPAAMSMQRWRYRYADGSASDWIAPSPGDHRVTSCGQQLTPLTDDLGLVRNRVNALTTNGQTYLPSGLMWGWRVLDPATPYSQASSRTNAKNVMIFMTDGENSAYKIDEYHYTAGTNKGNARSGLTLANTLCRGIKNDNIELYTVAYNLQGGQLEGETSNVLRSCATSSSYAFTPDSRDELVDSFRSITANLAEVKLEY